MTREFIFKMHCADRPGILAAVTGALSDRGDDARDAASFGDDSTGEFFIRMHLVLPSGEAVDAFRDDIRELTPALGVRWELHDCAVRPKLLILVSKLDHCLVDLLHRWKTGALAADIPLVVSNHETVRELVEWHGMPFHHLPVSEETKPEQERAISGQ